MNWVVSILLASAMSAFSIIVLKLSQGKADIFTALTIYLGVSFLGALTIMIASRSFIQPEIMVTKPGIMLLCLAGLLGVLNEMFFLIAVYLDMPLSFGNMLYRVVPILMLFVVGIFVFKDEVTFTKLTGFLFSCLGIWLVLK